MLFRTIAAAVVLSAAVAGHAVGRDLISTDEPLSGWKTGSGEEFPGAKVSLEVDSEASRSGSPALKLHGDFTRGGRYVEANYAFDPAIDVRDFSLWVKHPDADELTVRIIDATGQCHQLKLIIEPTGQWQQVRFPLAAYFENMGTPQALPGVKQYQKWDGAADGKWHGPASSIHFLTRAFDAEARIQTLWLSDVRVTEQRLGTRREPVVRTLALDDFLKIGEVDWARSEGREFPGAKVSLTAEKVDNEYALKLAGDFSGGGGYVEMRRRFNELDVEAVRAFNLELKSENVASYNIRLIDGSGQVFQRKGFPLTPDEQWHAITVDPTSFSGAEHWSGANDGEWHHPARMLSIVLNTSSAPQSDKPVIYMRRMRADVLVPAIVTAASFREDFESDVTAWKTEGNVVVGDGAGMKDSRGLLLTRGENDFDTPTAAQGPTFAASAGTWEISGAARPDLFCRDNSFNAAVGVEWLDRSERVIERSEVYLAMNRGPWQTFRKRIEAPDGTKGARLTANLNKAYGSAVIDDLAAAYVAAAPAERRIASIRLSSERPGNLFYPEDSPSLDVQIEAAKPLPDVQQRGRAVVRDYWGAELGEPIPLVLNYMERQKQSLLYSGVLDLSSYPMEIGPYYELHVEIPREGAEPYREFTALARLPEAPAKEFPPGDVPFTSRNWDNRIKEYAVLSDRLGIRTYGIWSDWSAKPPFKIQQPGLSWAEELDMAIVARTAVHKIERHGKGYEAYTLDILRDGAKKMVETLGDPVLYVSNGNEPHGDYQKVKENVAAYEAVYEGVKAANPNLTVIGTSVGPEEDYFKAGFQDSLDQYDFHTYEDYRRIRRLFGRYEELFQKYGGRKPICSTELGLNSQGQTRRAVAISLIKKLTVFFEQGGAHCSWFGLLYPDPQGTKEYSAAQSHNVFHCRYRLYNPKLDAIAYYNMINGICVKKFREYKTYGDTEAYLFVDDQDRCLQILWNDVARKEIFVPLEGVDRVTAIRIDGSLRELNAAGQGITLDASTEPILLLYEQTEATLPEKLGEPALSLASELLPAVKGATTGIELSVGKEAASDIRVEGPRLWDITTADAGAGRVRVLASVPEATEAREARLRVSTRHGAQAELYVSIPIAGRLQTSVRPVADAGDGMPGVKVSIRNNGSEAEDISWSLELTRVLPMSGGTYTISAAEQPNAYFAAPADGVVQIPGRGEFQEIVPLADVDPKLIYAVRACVSDRQGRTLELDRYIGGFARVARVTGMLELDGSLDDADWKRTTVQRIDEQRQFHRFERQHGLGSRR